MLPISLTAVSLTQRGQFAPLEGQASPHLAVELRAALQIGSGLRIVPLIPRTTLPRLLRTPAAREWPIRGIVLWLDPQIAWMYAVTGLPVSTGTPGQNPTPSFVLSARLGL